MKPSRRLRGFLVAGIVVSLPVIITFYLLYLVFRLLDGLMGDVMLQLIGHAIPGLGLLLMLVLLTALGAFATRLVGKRLIAWGDRVLRVVPIVRSVYPTVKQLVGVFASRDESEFRRVALIEFPCSGVYSIGFVTGEIKGPDFMNDPDLTTLFVPDTPNPTNGRFVLVPRRNVRYLHISVEQALTMMISAGAVRPQLLQGSQEE